MVHKIDSTEEHAFLFAVGNGSWYGAGMKVSPEASAYGKMFHATMVKKVSKLEFIKAFPSVFDGTVSSIQQEI